MRTRNMVGRASVCCLALAVVAAGCMPRTVVHRNPGPHAKGIRYYLPKPYLFVTPYTVFDVGIDEVAGGTAPSDQYVTIKLEYLPDFSEQYSIQVRPGIGSADVNIKLEDGWKLTQIDQDLDSQLDEVIDSFANLLKAAAPQGIIPAPDAPGQQTVGGAKAVVRATNVPIGFYEAVIGVGPHCEKQIFGWRYLGFAPYSSCPLTPCGAEAPDCQTLDLYGLVFDNGIMTFRQLHQIAVQGDSGTYVRQRAVATPSDEESSSVRPAEIIPLPKVETDAL